MNFRNIILQWYNGNKRKLPWRETAEPYRIWVSEIILQQTRVDQGLPYYMKFIDRFPDVNSLAEATEQEVLNVWQGLGYYSRARNMHLTAKKIMSHFNGIFPYDYNSLIKFKGIGSYTAAAISSVCNSESKAAIDGNVTRVLSRYFGIQDTVGSSDMIKKIRWISAQLIPEEHPGDYNQAMMEYGAVVCTPAAPRCNECALNRTCFAFNNKLTGVLPVKKKAVVKRNRYFNYLYITTYSGKVVIKKRTADDIWKNLWDFPLIESDKLLSNEEIDNIFITDITGNENLIFTETYDAVHILTHQVLHIRFFTFRLSKAKLSNKRDYVLIDPEDSSYPFPRLIENFLKRNDIFFGYD